MAVTAHFMMKNEKGQLEYRSHLVAFRHVLGSHSGEHLAQEFFKIIDELGISHKVCIISAFTRINNSQAK
jgi:phosphoribosylcarboxyaminoimidazole (NCAIR) mutase